MTQKNKNKIDHGSIMAVILGVSFLLLVFWSVLPEMLMITLLGAGGLVTGSTALYAPSAFISIIRAWSDPGR